MNSEELIVNSEEYKCHAFDVGVGPVSAQNKKYKYNKKTVGACIARPQKYKCYENGITLIALIITIIIMLILAGVVLSLTLGERGIFKTAGDAASEYEKAKIKEEIEFAIMDIQGEEIANGNELTLEKINEKLPNKLGTTTTNEGNKVTGDYKGYDYEINDKFEVTIKGTVTGIQISYTLSNKEYTKDNIYLNVTATTTEGNITNITSKERTNKKCGWNILNNKKWNIYI